ncbi:DUF72 domain-containing protein [Gordonia sp. zg691]|uniref:DUF72 domain-containing protein n=1 Tax=Gordonia jinghuaiqii TaxID=2758710 RepID=UPI0016622451|nr:DUF72 domain-containing protein [Gordonia jinghuaiqii]MBD0862895.1 DUF72 domain-containing protein [Gordonia jinghuaiqii]
MLYIGTSGWQYKDWRGAFYPEKLPQRLWLNHYAERFSTAEVNNTFYRLPEKTAFEHWAEAVPPDFRMAAKMSRYLTHIKRLNEPAEPVQRFLDRSSGLGARLGPVLLQLPPNLKAQPDALAETLQLFPSSVQVAVEPRHDSWWTDEVREVLEKNNAALCWADRKSRALTPLWVTADFGYLRLHDGTSRRPMSYGVRAIDSWLRCLADAYDDSRDVYVYFNNDPGCAAIDNALTMIRRAKRLGMLVKTVGE